MRQGPLSVYTDCWAREAIRLRRHPSDIEIISHSSSNGTRDKEKERQQPRHCWKECNHDHKAADGWECCNQYSNPVKKQDRIIRAQHSLSSGSNKLCESTTSHFSVYNPAAGSSGDEEDKKWFEDQIRWALSNLIS